MTDTTAPAKKRPSKTRKNAPAHPSIRETELARARLAASPKATHEATRIEAHEWSPKTAVARAINDVADLALMSVAAERAVLLEDMQLRAQANADYRDAFEKLTQPFKADPPLDSATPVAGQSRAPYVPKIPGDYLLEPKDLPSAVVESAKTAFGMAGRELQMAGARVNGDYKGRVVDVGEFLVQQVRQNSVVIHDKLTLSLSDKLTPEHVNGSDVSIHYEGAKGKVYPRDAERERLEIIVGTIKKVARQIEVAQLQDFLGSMDRIRDAMWAQKLQLRQHAANARGTANRSSTQRTADIAAAHRGITP